MLLLKYFDCAILHYLYYNLLMITVLLEGGRNLLLSNKQPQYLVG